MPKLKIGSHSSISNGLERALYNVKIIGGDAVQIFSKSPRSRVIIPKFTENDMECTKDFIKNNDTYLVIHSSYLVLPVKGIETKFSANSVIEDMKTIGKLLDKSGCIIHMKGKNKDMTEEEDTVMRAFDALCFTGARHMKRLQGIKAFPTDMLYKCKSIIDLVDFVRNLFKKRLENK